jgi:hypothetical protein
MKVFWNIILTLIAVFVMALMILIGDFISWQHPDHYVNPASFSRE